MTATPRDDRPGDLVRGTRTVTGTVERDEGCTSLRVGTQQWALVGMMAASLEVGTTVRVAGQLTQASSGCASLNPVATLQVSSVQTF